jgi:hypothetical protein
MLQRWAALSLALATMGEGHEEGACLRADWRSI